MKSTAAELPVLWWLKTFSPVDGENKYGNGLCENGKKERLTASSVPGIRLVLIPLKAQNFLDRVKKIIDKML